LEEFCVQVTIDIPEAIARQIEQLGGSAERELLEAFVLEEYRRERLSRGRVSELLGLDFWETEQFLKEHDAYLHINVQDLERDAESLRKLLPE